VEKKTSLVNDWRARAVARLMVVGVLLGATVRVAAQAGPGACGVDHYTVQELPLQPSAINGKGVVAGTVKNRTAVTWSGKDGLVEVPASIEFPIAEGRGVSENGGVLLMATEAKGSKARSFLYSGGKLRAVEGDHARATAINSEGDIAGEAQLAGMHSNGPVLWKQGSPISLGACCGGRAIALNSQGQATGEAYDDQGRYRAFVWDEKQGLRLTGPAGEYTSGVAINDQGHALITGFTSGAWIDRNGKLEPIALSPKWPSQPHGINSCDVVVGGFGSNADENHAFVWDADHGFRDLNDLIPRESSWRLETAVAINDRGEIVGKGDHAGEDDAGFLLIPTTR
jgi:uncharacterized membrane protein